MQGRTEVAGVAEPFRGGKKVSRVKLSAENVSGTR